MLLNSCQCSHVWYVCIRAKTMAAPYSAVRIVGESVSSGPPSASVPQPRMATATAQQPSPK